VKTFRYDLVIVGAGSGGYAAARTARELGATVAFADHGPLGGLCILHGCMPSKTLLASSELVHEIAEGPELGVSAPAPQIDLGHIFARKRRIIEGFAEYRRAAIDTFPTYLGQASFETAHTVRVGEDVLLEARAFVVATGSVVAPAPLPGLAEAGFIDSDEVVDSERLPGSVIVLGGGYVGSELGQFLARMGVKTTFLVRARHLLSGEDADVGEALTGYFRAEDMDVRTSVRLSHVEVRDGQKIVHYLRGEEPESVAADEIFYALGRVPNIEGLGLERVGVAAHAVTGIEVGADMRTTVPHIFAVGDVTGQFPLVHVAIYQGELAARNAIAGAAEQADYSLQSVHTIFTDPQIAVVGRTEKELRAAGTPYVSGAYPFADHGKAVSINKTKGFVKMLASATDGKILGAAIVGAHASDLIQEVVVAMYYGGTAADFVKIPHLHPTMAEILTYPAEEIVAQLAARRDAVAAAV
jgi:pyruvate/2-oxoglutarate dehydrogenase complex dihydrolipoamide dehydrogenase (E3) component